MENDQPCQTGVGLEVTGRRHVSADAFGLPVHVADGRSPTRKSSTGGGIKAVLCRVEYPEDGKGANAGVELRLESPASKERRCLLFHYSCPVHNREGHADIPEH